MPSHPGKASLNVNNEDGDVCGDLDSTIQDPVDDVVDTSENEDDSETPEEKDILSYDYGSSQLVVYDSVVNGVSPCSRGVTTSIGSFTVQCANCFQWRLIPTKEKYEEIREHILESPFVCEIAREWRPDISCDDPADINQDGSRLWAIDKPNIPLPPPGWQRQLSIRGEGKSKFADVYYIAPSGKKLRSMVEIQRFLFTHPEYASSEMQPSQFSFQTPRPLVDNYVRKRPARPTIQNSENHLGESRPLEPQRVNPLSWAVPDDGTDLELGGQYSEASIVDPVARPSKKKARTDPFIN